jgi:hypothetical protein
MLLGEYSSNLDEILSIFKKKNIYIYIPSCLTGINLLLYKSEDNLKLLLLNVLDWCHVLCLRAG